MATVDYKIETFGDWHYVRQLEVNRLTRRLQRYVGREMEKAVKTAAREIQKTMRHIGPRNARLTVLLKGRNRPLRKSDEMLNAVTTRHWVWAEAFAGILESDRTFYDAVNLHEGVAVPVTPAMRGLFLILSRVSAGKTDPAKLYGRAAELYAMFQGPWKALEPDRNFIVIPARPFVTETLGRSDWQDKVLVRLREAVRKAFDVKKHRA